MARSYSVVGTRPPRVDAAEKVTGKAIYAPDIRLPGMIHGHILRSPHAHARILSMDTQEAERLPGVYAVVTARDLGAAADRTARVGESFINFKYSCDNMLASDKVLYVGHAVAAVAARTPDIAVQAAELIKVDYEVLPAVTDVLAAMRDDAPLLHPHLRTYSLAGVDVKPSNVAEHFQQLVGDPDVGFAQADAVVEHEFRSLTVHQGYLEPHAATAIWHADDTVTIYTTTQGSFSVRDFVAELLHMPISRIKVIPTEVGGAFGGKNSSYVDIAAVLLSRKAGGRPVRMIMSRADVFTASGPSSGTVIRVKMAATREGKFTAVKAELFYEAGAYPGSPVGSGAHVMLSPYEFPNGQVDGYDVVVNLPKISSYRAPGGTPANSAVEQVIDELAVKLGIDPIELRLRNCVREGSRTVSGSVHGSIGAVEVLEAARAHPHYSAPLEGPNRGRGVAFAFWGNWGARSSCLLSVNEDGTLNMVVGSVDITGTRTSLAMQAAETLEIPLELIKPAMGDTDSVGYADTSGGSRTTMASGVAAVKAAQDVLTQMRARAAWLLDTPVENVQYARGVFTNQADPEQTLTFAEVAAQQSDTGGFITGVGNVNVERWGSAFGAHIADVEVDPETGQVTLLRYTAVQDVGRAIHPTQVEGQIQGGAVQGIGWALYEGYVYNDAGQMLNANLLDYKLPTALDIPPIETVLVEVPYPEHPYGVRGVGEVPILPPPAAIGNAIYRAIGRRVTALPMNPARVLETLLAD